MAKVICPCYNITDDQLAHALRTGQINTVDEFIEATRAGAACGQCRTDLARILENEVGYQREMEEPNG